jgi:pyruvate/2-oxoglutarate dehydrogenase complex dihydrolipoamide dehydrogenase (E3) component
VLQDGSAVETDRVILAAGREPLTSDLGLETIGVRCKTPARSAWMTTAVSRAKSMCGPPAT